MNNYTFGNYLCELREKKGLTQSQLGEKVGVSNKAISKWENGGAYPSSELMLPLARELGVSIEALYSAMSNYKAPKTGARKILEALVQKRRYILLAMGAYVLAMWVFLLLFGNAADKMIVLILLPVVSVFAYGALRLIFLIVYKNPMASAKYVDVSSLFFIFVAFLSVALSIMTFVVDFPNGVNGSTGAELGMIAAVLHANKKRV